MQMWISKTLSNNTPHQIKELRIGGKKNVDKKSSSTKPFGLQGVDSYNDAVWGSS